MPSLGIGTNAKVVAYDTASKQVEGQGAGHQTVVLEYASVEEAQAAYDSEAYQAVLPLRLQATSKHFGLIVLVEPLNCNTKSVISIEKIIVRKVPVQ